MTTNEREEVLRTVKAVWERFLDRDPQGMLALLDEHCTVWDTFQPQLVAKQTIADYVARDFAQSAARGTLSHTMEDFVVDIWGDTALVRFTTRFSYAPPNAISRRGRTTVVLRRTDDAWRLVHVHEGERPSGVPPVDA